MDYYRDTYDDYQIIWDITDDEEVVCACGGVFYRLGDKCICTDCGRKIGIDDIEAYINHEIF